MDNINNRTRTLTAEIVKDFIIHRLQKAGYENDIPGGSQLSFEAPGPAYRSMRMMGDEFYTAYFNAFEDMTGTINIHNGDLKDIFFTILEQTCETGLNWGRMVGMFVFSAMIAVKAMACGRTDVVENIIEWASDYLEHERFSNWINQHGGWDGFVQYHTNPKTRNQEMDHYIWNKACTGVGYLVSGVATFANILMH